METRKRPSRSIPAILASFIAAISMATTAHAADLVISGVVDGPLSGGLPKAIEIYVVNDIPDLSLYGLSSANNGGGSTGAPEFPFPMDAVTAGTFLYVTTDAPSFTAFFGFAPDYVDGAAPSINGDDAIELFGSGVVIDTFGDPNTDGTGQPWEYLDGWAYRVANTGPDGGAFNLASWTFSGPNALDGETTNATAAVPFPIGTYARAAGAIVINEFLADPPADLSGDANGDGTRNATEDEFVEIVNTSGGPLDISGWSISDGVGTRHAFPAGTVLEANCGAVVFGGGSPTGSFGNVVVQTASSGALGLNNGGDSVILRDATGAEVASSSYGSEGGQDQSLTRSPDVTGPFVGHLSVSGAPFSAGTQTDGSAFGGCAAADPVAINEIHADPAPDITGDANGDGTRDAVADEFVEIVNVSGGDLDVSGWTVSDAVGARHVFPAGSVVEAGCSAVVFGGGLPSGIFGGSLVQTASTGLLGFNNGGDSIVVRDASGAQIISAAYGGEGGQNQSLTRNPDITGNFVPHTSINGALFSPGTRVDGSAFDGCTVPLTPTPIYEVQGAGAASPLQGQTVLIEGVVTGDLQAGDADTQNTINGFYVQEQAAESDGDALTSDGIFVFDGLSPTTDVQVGDLVEVTGSVQEFFGETQLVAATVTVVSSGSPLPPPATIAFPASAVIFVGDEYIPDLERFEGMYVTLADTLYVTDVFNLDRFGEIQLIAGGVPFQFTNFAEPDAAGLDAHLRDIGSRTIMLDDGLLVQNPDPIRYPPPGLPNDVGAVVRSGDTVSGLTGNIRYSRGTGGSGDDFYRLFPTQEPVFVTQNERPATPPDVGGSLKVASFNVLNYFTTLDLPGNLCGPELLGCRGADSAEEFARQQAKIVAAITAIDADVFGLIELENSDGETLSVLVDALNGVAGPGTYDYVDTGFIGTDAIKVGFIYKPSAVVPDGPYAILDSSVDPSFIDTLNRPVLAQTFRETATAGVITLAINHLKSKGSPCNDVGDPDTGDGQGNCNLTRAAAAQATVNWLATDPTGSGDDDFLVIGDMNAYLQEDPIDEYRDGGYTDLLGAFVGPGAYTYSFDQQRGILDHALASAPLVPQVTGASVWHINTDEADALDYNLDFGRNPDIFEPDVYRSSDHEPVIVGLNLVGDLDRDGVLNADDVCPATQIPEAVPTLELKPNRFALVDGDLIFDSGRSPSKFFYTTIDTAGCSCEQIIAETGSGKGHTKFGCSNGLMEEWVEFVSN